MDILERSMSIAKTPTGAECNGPVFLSVSENSFMQRSVYMVPIKWSSARFQPHQTACVLQGVSIRRAAECFLAT